MLHLQKNNIVNNSVNNSVKDSDVSPYIEQKDVILCRSGIQLYHKSELASFITEDNKPPLEKEVYKEYRPASVVVKAQDKCRSLPVIKEHPNEWVTPRNWRHLAGGVLDREISVVALDGESEGEIGLKSNITFFTDDLYSYYLENKEVSLGYTCSKHFVPNPEEVGYDILLDEIIEVNHLAITRAGRGGSSVAVIDSIIGGLKPMRTGIFAWLTSKKQAVNDSALFSFGNEVMSAVKNSKGTTEEEIACEMKGVLDSMSELKDCDAKNTLVNVVKDCFDNKDKALANEKELTKTLDTMWVDIHSESLSEIAEAFAKLVSDLAKGTVATKDSEGAEEDENKDSEETPEDENKDSEEKPKEEENKESCNKDSAQPVTTLVTTKDDILAVLDSKLPQMVEEIVKDVLGIKDNAQPKVTGSVLNTSESISHRDYASFLD